MTRFWLRVTPRAGKDEIREPVEAGVLHIRVRAAPADGAANEAVIRLLAARLTVPPTSLRIVSGTTARRKMIELDDAHRDRLERTWPGLVL